jgi:nitroreductase
MENDLLELIKKRHSTRAAFDPDKKVVKNDLEKILESATWSPTAHNMQNFNILVIDDKDLLEKIGKIKTKISADFIRENFNQLSFSTEELKKKKVGIMGTMFPPSWYEPNADFEKIAKETPPSNLGYTMKDCPTLLIITYDKTKRAPASENDVLGFISLGCVMENMWLMAESIGISMQIMSVFAAEGDVEKQLKEILSIPDYQKIAFAIRLGYPVMTVDFIRVRRNVEDFTSLNGFNNKFTVGN